MKAINAPLLLIVFLILWTACSRSVNSADDLRAFVAKQSNGLTKEKTIGEIKVRLTYRPTDLLVQQELGGAPASPAHIEQLRQQYDDYLYFLLTYSANGKEIEGWRATSQAEFGTRVQTLAFGMAEVLSLNTDQRDSIPLVDFLYQRTFGGGSSSDVLFAFDRAATADADWLSFRLDDIGLGIGTTHFRFDTKAINTVPSIPFVQ